MGIATVYVTALPTIAQMVGANRILRGVAITHQGRREYVDRIEMRLDPELLQRLQANTRTALAELGDAVPARRCTLALVATRT